MALPTFRATSHFAMPTTLPKSPSGPDGTSCSAGSPAPSPAAHVAFFFIGLAGLTALPTFRVTPRLAHPLTLPKLASGPAVTSCPAGIPAPSPVANVAFFFIGLPGACLATYLPGWLGGQLFVSFSRIAVLALPVWRKGPRPFLWPLWLRLARFCDVFAKKIGSGA